MRVKDIMDQSPNALANDVTIDFGTVAGLRWPHIAIMRGACWASGEYGLAFLEAIRSHILPAVKAKCDEFPIDENRKVVTGGVTRDQDRYKWGVTNAKGQVRFATWQSLRDAYLATLDGLDESAP